MASITCAKRHTHTSVAAVLACQLGDPSNAGIDQVGMVEHHQVKYHTVDGTCTLYGTSCSCPTPPLAEQVPGLPGVTYGDVAAAFSDTGAEPKDYTAADYRRDANLADATGTPRTGRYVTVKKLRQEAREVLTALVPDHATFRVAVKLDSADKLRFFQIDTPLKGRWVGCLFLKEQASDETYKVRDIAREEAVLRAVIHDAHGALTRYGLELGSCGMCGRTLTDEESRARGIGPICADKGAF